jgi:DNA-binding CsgD family transcriptional regulator
MIAGRLGISPKTVGHHVAHVYEKLGVSTRAGATLVAAEHGLVGR